MKQETLEEAILRIKSENEHYIDEVAFELGVNWQQERSYSEEEVFELLENLVETFNPPTDNLKKWFECIEDDDK